MLQNKPNTGHKRGRTGSLTTGCAGAPFCYIKGEGHEAFSAVDHQRCTGRGPAAGGCDGGELCLYHAGRLPGCCRAVRRPGAGDQWLLLAGAAAGRPAGQGVCQPCHPHGAEAGHPVHGAPGHYSAGLGQLHHSDHPNRGRQCGVCRQRERIPELPLPGQRRIQGRNDPLARAQGRHGHPVRGRQHRCPAQKSGAGAPRKARSPPSGWSRAASWACASPE